MRKKLGQQHRPKGFWNKQQQQQQAAKQTKQNEEEEKSISDTERNTMK